MKKRFLCAISAALAISVGALAPAAVSAAAPAGTTYVCQIGSVKYASVHAALADIKTSAKTTVTMLANAADTTAETISGKNITFALGGYNLIFKPATGIALNLKNSAVSYTGKGTLQAVSLDSDALDIDGGSCALTYAKTSGGNNAIDAINATVTVNGNIDSVNNLEIYGEGLRAESGSKVTVNGNITAEYISICAAEKGTKVTVNGNVSGETGLDCQLGASISVTGDVTARGEYPHGIYCDSNVTVNGSITVTPTTNEGGDGVNIITDTASRVTVSGNISITGKYASAAVPVVADGNATVTVGGALSGNTDEIANAVNGAIIKVGAVPADSWGFWGSHDVYGGDYGTYAMLDPSNTPHIVPDKFAGYTTYTDDLSHPIGYIAVKIPPQPTVTRLFGLNRYATAVAVAKKGWTTSGAVLLAGALNYPDALAGVTLAAMKNAPILLTDLATTPGATMAEIRALKAKNIILLGGVGVISAAQESALKKAGYNVTRYYGTNRFGTAAAIGNAVEKLGGSKTAIVTTGMAFPDALVMGPYAGITKMPVVFTDTKELPAETQKFIKDNKIAKIILVNDGNDVSAAVITKVKNLVGSPNVTVITAADRYDLSAKIANAYKGSFANGVAVATGADFPDALTGGVLAAKMKYPVLLLNPKGVAPAEKSYVKSLVGPQIYVFGGTGVVTDSIVQSLYK